MAVSKEDILSAVADMSVMDLVELIEAMEEKFGVTAAAAVAAAPAAAGGPLQPANAHAPEPLRVQTGPPCACSPSPPKFPPPICEIPLNHCCHSLVFLTWRDVDWH